MEEGIVREFGMDVYTLTYLKWITNKDLRCNTGNSAQPSCVGLNGSVVRGRMDRYMAGSPFYAF